MNYQHALKGFVDVAEKEQNALFLDQDWTQFWLGIHLGSTGLLFFIESLELSEWSIDATLSVLVRRVDKRLLLWVIVFWDHSLVAVMWFGLI